MYKLLLSSDAHPPRTLFVAIAILQTISRRITGPFETDLNIDSTAPATRNRLRLGFCRTHVFCIYS